MSILQFTLSPERMVELHDALSCLAKFHEMVSLEAASGQLILSTLNQAGSSYASFALMESSFFSFYKFDRDRAKGSFPNSDSEVRFTCQMYNKALLSVFRRSLKEMHERDTAIDRCECHIQDSPLDDRCRFVIKMLCRHGVTKTYELTYEDAEIRHAIFPSGDTRSKWSISSLTLRAFVEYFGAGTEQLDMFSEHGHVTFTSYTERVTNGKDILKQPLQTSITLDQLEFDHFDVAENIHIGITVKDFKAIAAHAETLKGIISVEFSMPYQPLLVSYGSSGLKCEFILATTGDYRGPPIPPTASRSKTLKNSTLDSGPAMSNRQTNSKDLAPTETSSMPPPPTRPEIVPHQREISAVRRPSPPIPKASLDPHSLFLPQYDEEDQRWGQNSLDHNEEDDMLGWSTSAAVSRSIPREESTVKISEKRPHHIEGDLKIHDILPPTQKLSEIDTLFDD